MTNADKFKGIFGIYASALWAKSEKEFLEWLNEDVPDTNLGDTISRQAAIDAIMEEPSEVRYPSWYAEKIKKLPSAQRKGKWKPFDLTWGRSVYSCSACGNAFEVPTDMGKPMYKFCPNCGAKMKGEEDETD